MDTLNDCESETIEYKEGLAEKEDAGRDICAFANKNGGVLYFGAKNNGKIKGIQGVSDDTIRGLSQLYCDNIEPKIILEITIENYDGKKVVKVIVPKSVTPYHTYKGIPYIRVSSESRKMGQDEYTRRLMLYRSFNQDYSSNLVREASIKDLSSAGIKRLRNLLMKSGRFKRDINSLGDLQLLKDLNLIQENTITVAALVLLGKEESLDRLLPFAEIRYGYKTQDSEIRNQDMEVFKGGYLLNYGKIWNKINSRNLTLHIPQGLLLRDRKAFEEETIREAINNAIIHRDYYINESVFINQFQDKIVIKSPGGFVEGINIENIRDESKTRNKLIADTLYKCEFVEQFGTGVNLMYKNQLSLGKNPPDYSQSTDKRISLELDGIIKDIDFAKYVLTVTDEQQRELSDQELIILNNIKENKKIKTSELTKNLLESGLIEKIGYSKYILSKKYYFDTQQKGVYINKKRMVYLAYKSDLLNYFLEYKRGQMRDFIGGKGTLFEDRLAKHHVNKLLAMLKEEGKIEFVGDPHSIKSYWQLKGNQ